MARVTVEDCVEKVSNRFDLVLEDRVAVLAIKENLFLEDYLA